MRGASEPLPSASSGIPPPGVVVTVGVALGEPVGETVGVGVAVAVPVGPPTVGDGVDVAALLEKRCAKMPSFGAVLARALPGDDEVAVGVDADRRMALVVGGVGVDLELGGDRAARAGETPTEDTGSVGASGSSWPTLDQVTTKSPSPSISTTG